MNKPLLDESTLPNFSQFKTDHIEPTIDSLLDANRKALSSLLERNTHYSWDNLLQPLEDCEDRLNRAWSPVSHLHSVADNEQLRAAYNACLPKLTEYATELGQNEDLYRAYKQIRESDEFPHLEQAQQKIIDNALRDFRLSGIGLELAKRQQFKQVRQQLSQLQTKFEENLLDATQAWSKHIEDKSKLQGLPESALALAAQNAKREDKSGWLFTLDSPSYMPVLQYAEDTSLRQEMYQAYATRASEQGPHAGKWDNSDVMQEILALRQQMAALLGFNSYADYSLVLKMANSTDEVLDFLNDLAARSKLVAKAELAALQDFAREHFQLEKLEAWDIPYYSEKLRQHTFSFSQEELRPYFAVPQVLKGMFEVVKRLFGLVIKEKKGIDVWHPDVLFFQIYDGENELRGSFYLDIYARSHKRGGAWMDECVVRKRIAGALQRPVAYLTCNFTPPIGSDPSLLTHDDVITLFHEFGHGLHHMLTQIDFSGVSGINGVPWDAVELPSQFMENWCWEADSLDLIACHYQTGEALPPALFDKILQAKNFHSGLQMLRQLELALFDFHLHLARQANNSAEIQALLDKIRKQIAVIRPPDYNRLQHSFSHIFAGGYAAGYYSYKWAEVLSADAFSKFEENGIFDKTTGQQFLHSILEQGGARDPMELFVKFRGRKPSIEPLLRQSGILPQQTGNSA